MEVLLNREQFKFIVVKNFLPHDILEAWQARARTEEYEPGLISTPTNPDDLKPQYKRNLNRWYRDPDELCAPYHRAYWSEPIQSAMRAMGDLLFDAQRMVTSGNFLLSQYNQGDHYDWHQDLTPYTSATWIVQPADQGGLFELSSDPIKPNTNPRQVNSTVQNRMALTLEANDLCIFPSHYYHRVTPVVSGTRVSLQYFCNRDY